MVSPTYTYRPKMGDVVIFPNGVEFNYSEADEAIIVMTPEGTMPLIESAASARLAGDPVWKLTVTE